MYVCIQFICPKSQLFSIGNDQSSRIFNLGHLSEKNAQVLRSKNTKNSSFVQSFEAFLFLAASAPAPAPTLQNKSAPTPAPGEL